MTDDTGQSRDLRVLRWLVATLTATMIAASIAMVALFWARLPRPVADFPPALALPEGAVPAAITRGRDFIAVVTEAGEILVFSRDGTTLIRRVEIAD